MNRIKRALAGLLALTISAASMGAVSADAYGIPDVPNSAFEYELRAEVISDTRIAVGFEITNNPGFTSLGFAIRYDEDCSYAHKVNLNEACVVLDSHNTSERFVYNGVMVNSAMNNGNSEYSGLTVFWYYFDVDNAYDQVYEFSVAIADYQSPTENIVFSKTGDITAYDFAASIGVENEQYTLGDMDNDGLIEISDASDVLSIVSANSNNSMSVATLNNKLQSNATTPINWCERFPNLICAEVADVDLDNFVEEEDANKILEYYSNASASTPVDSLIGTSRTKTLVVDL